MNDLGIEGIRAEIDALDEAIIRLIAQRQGWVVAAGRLKQDRAGVRAPDRVERVISIVRGHAERSGASEEVVERTYRAMIGAFIDLELSVHDGEEPAASSSLSL